MKHVFSIAFLIALLILCTLLPFMPGEYDPLAATLMAMARTFGFLGLALVPVGIVWLAFSRSQRFAGRHEPFARAALIVTAIVWGAMSMAAVLNSGWALGIVAFVLAAYAIVKLKPRLKAVNTATPALYLMIVPLAVFLLQQALLPRAVEFSRNRAIANAATLIADIDAYRAARGAYPLSLLATQRDYKPGVIGVDRYRYEPSGRAYNVLFELPSITLGTQEISVYNPLDEQQATAHPMDILQYSPEHLERTRGYYGSQAAPQPHWKYFWFD